MSRRDGAIVAWHEDVSQALRAKLRSVLSPLDALADISQRHLPNLYSATPELLQLLPLTHMQHIEDDIQCSGESGRSEQHASGQGENPSEHDITQGFCLEP
jgi:hypothetical protein